MITVKTTTQCLDKRTKHRGSFGYLAERPLYSVTPVFKDYVELIHYMAAHNIRADYDTRVGYWQKVSP